MSHSIYQPVFPLLNFSVKRHQAVSYLTSHSEFFDIIKKKKTRPNVLDIFFQNSFRFDISWLRCEKYKYVWNICHILLLYCDERRGIRWNIGWAQGKSRGRSPINFLRAYRLPWLKSQCSHSQLPLLANIFSYWLRELAIFSRIGLVSWPNTGPYTP